MTKSSMCTLALCACLVVPHAPVYAASSGATAETAEENCDIDTMMDANRLKMDQMAVGIYKANLQDPIGQQIETAPTVKDASCLPILDTLDSLIRLRIPSIGGALGGIMAKIRDMACKYANDFIASVVKSANYNISDPYGIASVGVGGSTTSGGVETQRYDFGKVVQDAVVQAAKNKAAEVSREAVSNTKKTLPSPTSDRLPNPQNSINNAASGVLNGL